MTDHSGAEDPHPPLVKVRGYRIDLGTIEAALARCPGVHQVVVVAREDTAGEKRVVAYVVGDASPVVMRTHLRGSLPEYMIPVAFVVLNALPLTKDGKVDVDALPAPGAEPLIDAFVALRGPTEEALAKLWGELLGVARVSASDDFFHLGGNSLLGMQLIARIREEFGCELPLRALLETPTLSRLAWQIDDAKLEAMSSLLDELDALDERTALPDQQEAGDIDPFHPSTLRQQCEGYGADPTRLTVVADLDAVPADVLTRLLGALDGVHRAWGGGGLELESVEVGTAAEAGVRT